MKNINVEELDYYNIVLLKKVTGLYVWQLFQMAMLLLMEHLKKEIDEYEQKQILKDPENFTSSLPRRKH